jgi:hypothetical protein
MSAQSHRQRVRAESGRPELQHVTAVAALRLAEEKLEQRGVAACVRVEQLDTHVELDAETLMSLDRGEDPLGIRTQTARGAGKHARPHQCQQRALAGARRAVVDANGARTLGRKVGIDQ